MSREIAPFGLRMPADLKLRLAKHARKGARSLNAEINLRLSESVEATERPLHSFTDGELIKELMDRYERGVVSIRIGHPDEEGGER